MFYKLIMPIETMWGIFSTLNWGIDRAFNKIKGNEFSDVCKNRTCVIEKRLRKYADIAANFGKKGLRVICEPTGQYQNKLMRTLEEWDFLPVM